MRERHGGELLWISNLVVLGVGGVLLIPRPYGVGLRKNIKRGWRMFSSHTRFELGDSSKIRIWHDVWCGEKAFLGFI